MTNTTYRYKIEAILHQSITDEKGKLKKVFLGFFECKFDEENLLEKHVRSLARFYRAISSREVILRVSLGDKAFMEYKVLTGRMQWFRRNCRFK